jgi:hypothetical protein
LSAGKNQDVNISRSDLLSKKKEDDDQINLLLSRVFLDATVDEEDIYFDEFVKLTETLGSELYVAVIDCIYKCVPCVKNFFLLRSNFISILEREDLLYGWRPNLTVLAPVYLSKINFRLQSVFKSKRKTYKTYNNMISA